MNILQRILLVIAAVLLVYLVITSPRIIRIGRSNLNGLVFLVLIPTGLLYAALSKIRLKPKEGKKKSDEVQENTKKRQNGNHKKD